MFNSSSEEETNEVEEYKFSFKFEITNVFPASQGKYPQLYGNVAFIDCHFVFDEFITDVQSGLDPRWFEDYQRYAEVYFALEDLK